MDTDTDGSLYLSKSEGGDGQGLVVEGLLEELNNLDLDGSSGEELVSKMMRSLNNAGWDKTASRAVLAAMASSMGVGDGLAWLDFFPAEIERRALETKTDQA